MPRTRRGPLTVLPSMAAVWISHLRGLARKCPGAVPDGIWGLTLRAPGAACGTVWSAPHSYIHPRISSFTMREENGARAGPENAKAVNRLSLPFRRPQAGKQTTEGLSNTSGVREGFLKRPIVPISVRLKSNFLVRTR